MKYVRKELRSGFLEYQVNETGVWITASEANSPGELIVLYKEIRNLLDSEYPSHSVQWFIDATNEKLMEAFINHPEFSIEYVSFSLNREKALFQHECVQEE